MSNNEKLQPLDYLVGGTWTARGEIPGIGRYTVERTYHWILEGQFIEQHHVMELSAGTIETRGILGWDAEKGAIAAWGFGSDGGFTTSHSDHAAQNEIRFLGVRVGGFNAGPVRGTFQKVSDNEFHELAEAKNGGEWRPMFSFHFTRQKNT